MTRLDGPLPIVLYRRPAKKPKPRTLQWSIGGMLLLTTLVATASAVLRNFTFVDGLLFVIGSVFVFAMVSPIIVCTVVFAAEAISSSRSNRRTGDPQPRKPRRVR